MGLSAILGSPKIPAAPTPPPAPTTNTAATAEAARLEREKSRRGFASTILTSPTGVSGQTTATKTLLGQ